MHGCGQCEEMKIRFEETAAGDAATAPTYRYEEQTICKRCRMGYEESSELIGVDEIKKVTGCTCSAPKHDNMFHCCPPECTKCYEHIVRGTDG